MKTLLIIEDKVAIAETTVELLYALGFTTLGASGGKTGLGMVHVFAPDLVFCEVDMVGFSGYEVLAEIRTCLHVQTVPFYFLAALTEPNEVQKGLQLGATGYIKKPYSELDLLNCFYKEFPSSALP